MHGPKWSNLAMNTCDVLVAIGARFDDRVTGKLSAFAPGATVVHLDVDPAEISSSGTPTSRSSGRSRRRSRRSPTRSPASARGRARAGGVARQIRGWREEFPLSYGESDEWLKPQQVLQALQRLTAAPT